MTDKEKTQAAAVKKEGHQGPTQAHFTTSSLQAFLAGFFIDFVECSLQDDTIQEHLPVTRLDIFSETVIITTPSFLQRETCRPQKLLPLQRKNRERKVLVLHPIKPHNPLQG